MDIEVGQSMAPLKNITIIKNILGGFIFGALVHCASRNYTWKAGILPVIDGVGHYIENLEGGGHFRWRYIKSM